MDPIISEEVSITDLFDQFVEATTMRTVLSTHHRIMNYAGINPCEFNVFFPKLKQAVMTNRKRKNWKAKALFSRIEKKAAHRCYSNTKAPPHNSNKSRCDNQQVIGSHNNSQECLDDSVLSQSSRAYGNNNALQNYSCLVIGSGPAGLRTAIELQLLGASRVVVVEKRNRFSRNNVLHLWPFVIDDLKSLGAKKFYGKFCAGSIDHISIRQLQLILLKICLMIGCDFRDSCSYSHLCPTTIKQTVPQIPSNGINSDTTQTSKAGGDNIDNVAEECDIELQNDHRNSDKFIRVSDQLDINDTDCFANESARSKNRTVNTESPKLVNIKLDTSACRSIRLQGTRAHFQSDYKFQEEELHSFKWDIIIGADGRRNTLSKFFPRKEFRGRLAIAITANFVNRQTPAEAAVSEISGLSYIYNQDMFNALAYDTNIQLENICYYKDDTHYFVMTAKKKSLLERGVLINDHAATHDLLSDSNVDRQALLKYAKDAAHWTTGLEPLDFELNHYGHEDCAMFDFTSMYAASNACKALRTKEGGLTLVGLVGDSLLEPFWPTGSGCARGFLSSFDAAWMCRQWAVNKCAVIDYHNPNSSRSSRNRSSASGVGSDGSRVIEPTTYNRMALSVMAERESIYRILAQTTSENLQQNYTHWTLNPHSRYPNLNRHLVAATQVEHLITDNEAKINSDDNRLGLVKDQGRRIKSPSISKNSRKSPKKLKSANSSPIARPRNINGRSKSLSKHLNESSMDKTYQQFEESYKNLDDDNRGANQYLNFRRRGSDDLPDDLFIPSISGTLPSSNNLMSLEARRARDIDECLRLRRQRTQLSVVRDQLFNHLNDGSHESDDISQAIKLPKGAALFSELKRIREQQSKGKENWHRDVNGPLTLLNSIRRCASFAERVKSFESKLTSSNQVETTPSTPKTPIETVKNLPEFLTLQELFVNNSSINKDTSKKFKLPVMKLSKDDWNVKCWERRLASHRQKRNQYGSSKSLNEAFSAESNQQSGKPEKQVEVFKDRIKEMAEKLQKTRDQSLKQKYELSKRTSTAGRAASSFIKTSERSQGNWVSHLRKELIKGTEVKRPQDIKQQRPMNPSAPNQPIKKLFEDDDNDDDGIDVNKHYDHLCVNRPTNKYLPRNTYTSHLTRTKYNSATSKVINVQPSTASKQAYMALQTSRGSSASSVLSDYSTNTGESSSSSEKQQQVMTMRCYRCKQTVEPADKILIGGLSLHRLCLTCRECGITLRMNEIQHYLNSSSKNVVENNTCNFICAICNPSIRSDLIKEAADRLSGIESTSTNVQQSSNGYGDKDAGSGEAESRSNRIHSREEFLNAKINYSELYKNILDDTLRSSEAVKKIDRLSSSNSEDATPRASSSKHCSRKEDLQSVSVPKQTEISKSSPSPVTFNLPLNMDSESPIIALSNRLEQASPNRAGREKVGYRIARSETIDGSEQVTLVLPCSIDEEGTTGQGPEPHTVIDEDEIERRPHSKPLSKSERTERLSSNSSSIDEYDDELNREVTDSDSDDDDDLQVASNAAVGGVADDSSDESSSLSLPSDNDDEDETGNQNSTFEDVLTSDEFVSPSNGESDGDDDDDDNKMGETPVNGGRQSNPDVPEKKESELLATRG